MNLFVTGGTGFLGSAVTAGLLANAHSPTMTEPATAASRSHGEAA